MDSVVIGSAAGCGLRVEGDPMVSAEHCRVVRHEDGSLWVIDLGSVNGTFLSRAVLVGPRVFGTSVRFRDDLRVRGGPEPWQAGQTLWVGRSGLELDRCGWVRAVSR